MKLKGCISSLATSVRYISLFQILIIPNSHYQVHNLRVFLAIRRILNRSLPTIYPAPNNVCSNFAESSAPDLKSTEDDNAISPSVRMRLLCGRVPDRTQSSQSMGLSMPAKGILGRMAKVIGLIRSFYQGPPTTLPPAPSNSPTLLNYSLLLEDIYPICVVCRDPLIVAKQLPCGHILHQ